jgi:hypothetical protein
VWIFVQDYESSGNDAQKSAEIRGTEIGLYGYFDENFGILHKRELLKYSEILYSNSYEKSIANRTFHAVQNRAFKKEKSLLFRKKRRSLPPFLPDMFILTFPSHTAHCFF